MAKVIDVSDGFTLSDLMSSDGFTLEFGDEFIEDQEEEFTYRPDVQLTTDEVMNLLNMEEFLDSEKNAIDDDRSTIPGSVAFTTLKPKMKDIMGDGKVWKLVKRKGVGEIVPYNAQVTIHYVGYFEYRDEPFDSTYSHGGPQKIRLAQGELIAGLELGIPTMQKHEIAVFIIHPDLAYGEVGCLPRIPANEEVMFVVQLIDYLDNGSADTYENLSIEARKVFPNIVQRVNDMLNTAKDSFQRHKIKQAVREYKKAIALLEYAELKNDDEEQETNRLLSKAYTNLAVCYNQLDLSRLACTACNKVPILSAKCHFNHGRALFKMGEYIEAMQQLQTAYRLEPSNKSTIKEIQLVNEKQRKYADIEKRLWANCLRLSKDKIEASEFRKVVQEMCESFARDTKLLRHPLPEGLTAEEERYVREQAAAVGISVTTHVRYGKEVTYLNKPNY